mmetsp:Transcript_7129/g.18044  ORF Transcript_7129/g.18044 Transcript_7129/m.18044 type:complete len:152 (-) Transcript_7129:51-506(-)|eukprot:CAMPEP_0177650494 /NCGR_PEP_ID=MMETSP0447-20121125/11973_1 /TAXON_ID=0 /ORGANISM="Stygamoeba regulata, Strain BSH-02190019" /LENGTH=151 /DNA_ID=CAMNT_0019153369 /DNA_START=103 /DNA_END=558 /DNA_ORIENTATION=+
MSSQSAPAPSHQESRNSTPHARAPDRKQQVDRSASDVFVHKVTGMTSCEDIETILSHQQHILSQMESSGRTLAEFNHMSALTYAQVSKQFEHSMKMLLTMKRELDVVQHRITSLRQFTEMNLPSHVINDEQLARETQDREKRREAFKEQSL